MTGLPPAGVYVLEVISRLRKRLKIGQLGDLGLAPGVYLYVGSARRCLPHRIARHRQTDKCLHWHVDYITTHSQVARVAVWNCADLAECELAEAVRSLPGAAAAMNGFGASDCGCETHLVRLEGQSDWVVRLSDEFGLPLADVQYGPGR